MDIGHGSTYCNMQDVTVQKTIIGKILGLARLASSRCLTSLQIIVSGGLCFFACSSLILCAESAVYIARGQKVNNWPFTFSSAGSRNVVHT